MKLTSDGFYIYIGPNHKQFSNVTKQQLNCGEGVLEKKAEEELNKGYNRRNKTCSVHFVKMSVTGKCMFCE